MREDARNMSTRKFTVLPAVAGKLLETSRAETFLPIVYTQKSFGPNILCRNMLEISQLEKFIRIVNDWKRQKHNGMVNIGDTLLPPFPFKLVFHRLVSPHDTCDKT